MAKKTPAKKTPKKVLPVEKATRKLEPPKYQSFRLHKRIKHPDPKIKSGFKIFRACLNLLWKDRKLFGGIATVYLVLNILLVKGLNSSLDVQGFKNSLGEVLKGGAGNLATGFTIFAALLGTTGNAPNDQAAGYQSILLVIVSLAVIWALRQRAAGEKITPRDAYYKGMYPLIPYLMVLFIMALQLLPLALVAFLFNPVFAGGLAVTALEKILWGSLLFCLGVLSLYMVTSSVFGLYIVTLPEMGPMQALRSARELVRYRRWLIMRKIIFLPFILLVTAGIVTIPVILLLTPIAEWFFFVLTMMAIVTAHSYMYTLYRELL